MRWTRQPRRNWHTPANSPDDSAQYGEEARMKPLRDRQAARINTRNMVSVRQPLPALPAKPRFESIIKERQVDKRDIPFIARGQQMTPSFIILRMLKTRTKWRRR